MGGRGLSADALLLFLDEDGRVGRWLRLDGGAVTARGAAQDALPSVADDAGGDVPRVVAVAPANSVSLHWLEIPAGLAPAQAVGAARLIAAEVSALPLSDRHVAVGPESESGATRAVAIVSAAAMAEWLAALQAHGIDPDAVVPETSLLPRPADGYLFHAGAGGPLYRGRDDAFSIEPELAELVMAGAPVETLSEDRFEAGLPEAVAAPAVDLRQGAFAKRRRWKMERALVRRLAALALLILLVTLLIQVAAILRYTFAADALEQETEAVAARALRSPARLTNPPAQLGERLAELRGRGGGYGGLASPLFAAVQATPNAELTALIFDASGSLRATVQADSPATIAALRQRIEATGNLVDVGAMRSGGGRPTAELTVRAR